MSIVRMNDFGREGPKLLAGELAACERVLRSGWWILGREVLAFEAAWSDFLHAPEVVGCANGLDAIELGLRALGIGPGDEVITTPMTAFATVLGILRSGATPVLADIDPDTAMLLPESVQRCISARTKAVLLVHLYGRIGPVDEILDVIRNDDICLVEDCAQAHGAIKDGRSAGDFGSFGAWSFYPTKNLGAVGDAGALSTATPKLAETARVLRNYGQTERYHHPYVGMNSRLDELQAALLQERVRHLAHWVVRRRDIATRYATEIVNRNVRVLPLPTEPLRHAHHLFVVMTTMRKELQDHLRAQNVDSLIHYPVPIHRQEPCIQAKRDPLGLRNAESHAGTCLSLPCHPGLEDAEVARVIQAVNTFEV